MQLKTTKIDKKIKTNLWLLTLLSKIGLNVFFFQKWKEDVGSSDVKTTWFLKNLQKNRYICRYFTIQN